MEDQTLDSMRESSHWTLSRSLPTPGVLVPAYIDTVFYGDKAFLYYGELPSETFFDWVLKSKGEGEPPFELSDYKQPTLKTGLRGLLDQFVSLVDSRPEDILKFARKWGVLEVCEHLVPWQSCPHGHNDNYLEPISAWLNYARRARAILLVAQNLHEGNVGDPANWSVILGVGGNPREGWWDDFRGQLLSLKTQFGWIPLSLESNDRILVKVETRNVKELPESSVVELEKYFLGTKIDELLYLSGVRLTFDWQSREPHINISPKGSLLGALASQLAFAAARSEGVATCAACGQLYTPTRKPQEGRRHYCPACGERASKRDYARRRRNRG